MHLKRLLVASLLLSLACKSPTPAEQLDSVISWLGTAGMAGDAWLRHTTPDRYTRETLELSHDSLLQLADDLLKSPIAGVDTASLDSALTRSRGRIAEMARLVEQKNSPAFTIQLALLKADEGIVKQIADSLQPKQ
jgi:predicted kinase